MKTLSNKLLEVLENNGFSCNGEILKENGKYYVEINQSTPEGEDWWEIIWFDRTEEDFIKSVSEKAIKFDVDEESEVYIDIRGTKGVPNSIRALIDDAEWKKEKLQLLSRELKDNISIERIGIFTKKEFLEHIEENFTLNKRTCLDLLESIYDYAAQNNYCVHNYILEDLIGDALNLTDNERKMFCNVE